MAETMTERTRPPVAPDEDEVRDPRRVSFLGSGMSAAELFAILALSVLVFLVWGGPLWSAPAGASHVARIAVSYLLAPVAVLALFLVDVRWSWVHFGSAVALLWSAKLVVTASAYAWLASGSGTRYQPAQARDDVASFVAQTGYRPAAALPPVADLSGTVLERGQSVEGAVVLVDTPPPGTPLGAPRTIELTIAGGRHVSPTVLAATGDRILVENRDSALHTLRFTRDDRARGNVPLPAGSGPRVVPMPEPGVYHLSCENHPGESATLVVVDHPYAARTDGAGRFRLLGVPRGDRRLVVHRDGRPPHRRTLRASGPGDFTIETGEDP